MAGPEEGTAAASFVGRDRELTRVAGLLDEESAALAAGRGVVVAWARSADRDSSPPYGLWRLALAELPGHRHGEHGAALRLDLWSLMSERTAWSSASP